MMITVTTYRSASYGYLPVSLTMLSYDCSSNRQWVVPNLVTRLSRILFSN